MGKLFSMVILFSLYNLSLRGQIIQDFEVYKDGRNTVLRGAIDHSIIKSGMNAQLVIQYGIDQLKEQGGAIRIHRGTYTVSEPIRMVSGVCLYGAGRGTRIMVDSDSQTGAGIIMKGLKGTALQDLAIKAVTKESGKTGVVLDDCGDCKLLNVLAQGFENYGIAVINNSFLCEISSCVTANNGKAGFYFENLAGNGRGGEYVPNLVTNCISYGDQVGFEANFTIVLNLVGCVVYQSLYNGFYFYNSSNSIMVSGSRTFQVGNHAIEVDNSHEINITGNIFCWQRGHGAVFTSVRWGSCTGNNFIDNGVRTLDGSLMNGIVIEDTKGLQITGNAIFNWGDQAPMKFGIIEDAESENNIIANNNINYYVEKDVESKGAGTTISGNVEEGPDAYLGMDREKKYPDFNLDKIMDFIRE